MEQEMMLILQFISLILVTERMFQILLILEEQGVEELAVFIIIVFIKEVEEVLKLIKVDFELKTEDSILTVEEGQAWEVMELEDQQPLVRVDHLLLVEVVVALDLLFYIYQSFWRWGWWRWRRSSLIYSNCCFWSFLKLCRTIQCSQFGLDFTCFLWFLSFFFFSSLLWSHSIKLLFAQLRLQFCHHLL